jgi:signal transduction histidine kinase
VVKISISQPSPRERLPSVAQGICVFVGVVGGTMLLAWALNLQALFARAAAICAMNPLTALALILTAMALWRLSRQSPGAYPRDPIASGLAATVMLFGTLKLADHLFDAKLDIDQILFHERLTTDASPFHEMTVTVALSFCLCGAALLVLDAETVRGFRPAQAFILPVGLIALLALIGYSYRTLSQYSVRPDSPMSLITAVGFALLAFGALAARPDRGFMLVVTSATTGGSVARRLLPMAILIPWMLGAVRLLGEEAGYFQTEFGISSFAASTIVVFTLLIWWNAKLLYLADRERARTERRLAVQYNATRVLADAVELASAVRNILQAVCETLRWRVGAMWSIDSQSQKARCVEVWHANSAELEGFVGATRERVFQRGEGLPGRVWETGEPAWIADIALDQNFPRSRLAAQAGLHGAFGFPIRLGHETYGMMEFFSREIEEPDGPLLQMLSALGIQIGQFVERLRAEERLRQTSANLERSNTDLQQFAYVASHDLSEPLRMVISYLELLMARSPNHLDTESKEFIGYAIDGATRMQALIKDLLAYSRVDFRSSPFTIIDLDRLLQAVLANLKVAIDESRATITHDALPKLKADTVQLTQLFQNLIGNAIKFRGQEPPRVHIHAERRDAEWLFSVRDNGIGIDPKYFERIFVIFQRLHTRQEYSGTGIGLAICKRIIERHGGRIWLESTPGQGSTFLFTLPALPEA